MIISDIINEVITEVGGDTSDTALQANMLIFAKGALRRFPLFSRDRLLIDTSYATLSGTYLTTPTGFIREISLYYIDNGARRYIEKLSEKDFGSIVNTSSSGNPSYYRIVGNIIEFDKSCSDIVIYVEHYKAIDEVTAGSTFPGDNQMIEILKDGMKSTYYTDYIEDMPKGDKKLALFKAGLDELESKHMMSEQGEYIDEE